MFLLLVARVLSAQDIFPDVLRMDSFPGVKSIMITGYQVSDKDVVDTTKTPAFSTYYEFDVTGSWTYCVNVFPDGDRSADSIWYDASTMSKYTRSQNSFDNSLTTVRYDHEGRIISEVYDPEIHNMVSKEHTYDKKKRLVRTEETFYDQHSITEYEYNQLGQLMHTRKKSGMLEDDKLHLDAESFIAYNANGKHERTIDWLYSAEGNVRVRDTIWYEYDELGRLSLQKESRQNGESKTTVQYKYDAQNRTILREYIYSDVNGSSSHVRTSAEYDSIGYCTSFSDVGDDYGTFLSWQTTYNEKGFPLSCYYNTEAGTIYYKWEYVYR